MKTRMKQKTIEHKGKIIALIFRKEMSGKGTTFLTPNDYTLQLGLIEHPLGSVLRSHKHNPKIKYKVDTTQEFLYIEKGKVKVSLFSDSWELVTSEILTPGDFMLHVSGGHGFEILEDCRMIEIKQGPYPGEKRAKIFPKQ